MEANSMRARGRQNLFLVIAALTMGTLILGHLFGFTPAFFASFTNLDASSTALAEFGESRKILSTPLHALLRVFDLP
jgi:hypothetical protein